MSLPKRKMFKEMLTVGGWWEAANDAEAPESEKSEGKALLCEYYLKRMEEIKKEEEEMEESSESPQGARKRKGELAPLTGSACWLEHRSPQPDSGSEPASAAKRRSR